MEEEKIKSYRLKEERKKKIDGCVTVAIKGNNNYPRKSRQRLFEACALFFGLARRASPKNKAQASNGQSRLGHTHNEHMYRGSPGALRVR